jgi:hypothetical protein
MTIRLFPAIPEEPFVIHGTYLITEWNDVMKSTNVISAICLLVSGILTWSSYVYAGNRENALSLSLGGGYDYFSQERHIDNTGFPFFVLGYQLTSHVGIEGLVGGFITQSRRLEDDNRHVRGALVAVDGVYHFKPYHMLEPLVLAGVGVTSLNPNGTDANNEGNVNVGTGVEVFLEKSLALRFEVRDFYTIVAGKNDVIADASVTFLLDLC